MYLTLFRQHLLIKVKSRQAVVVLFTLIMFAFGLEMQNRFVLIFTSIYANMATVIKFTFVNLWQFEYNLYFMLHSGIVSILVLNRSLTRVWKRAVVVSLHTQFDKIRYHADITLNEHQKHLDYFRIRIGTNAEQSRDGRAHDQTW